MAALRGGHFIARVTRGRGAHTDEFLVLGFASGCAPALETASCRSDASTWRFLERRGPFCRAGTTKNDRHLAGRFLLVGLTGFEPATP